MCWINSSRDRQRSWRRQWHELPLVIPLAFRLPAPNDALSRQNGLVRCDHGCLVLIESAVVIEDYPIADAPEFVRVCRV